MAVSTGDNITLQAIAHALGRIADALEERNRFHEDETPSLETRLLETDVRLQTALVGAPRFDRYAWQAYHAWRNKAFPPADGPGAGPGEMERQPSTPSQPDPPSFTGSPSGPVSSSANGGAA